MGCGSKGEGWAANGRLGTQWAWIPMFALINALLLPFPTADRRPVGGGSVGASVVEPRFSSFPVRRRRPRRRARQERPRPAVGPPIRAAVAATAYVVLIVSILGAAVSIVARWRRADAVEREQLKWVAIAAAALGTALVANGLLTWSDAQPLIAGFADACLAGVFVAIGIAVLRHRLFDVDVVINRAIVYLVLIVFATGTYVVLVVGIGRLVGPSSGPAIWLSVVATTVVALAFAPVRERARRFANRVVYGETTAPYEVLADLGRRLAGALSPDDLLPSLARSAATGVGATAAEVRLALLDGTERRVTWPDDAPLRGDSLFVVPVTSGTELLGHISVSPRPGAALTRAQRGLITDLARQASAPLSNAASRPSPLARQLDHISARRPSSVPPQRLVPAQNPTRERLERDIHDGAQQQLVALTLELLSASGRASEPLSAELDEIRHHVGDILTTLRDLARGIFPPLLVEAGLGPALLAHIAKSRVRADVDDRLPPGVRPGSDVEAAVYFCCLEAMQNVTKHAGEAARATICLEVANGNLVFAVTDDGIGFDTSAAGCAGTGLQGMADRLAAIGGDLEVRSEPGSGTSVRGVVPTRGGAGTTPHA
jgi:signal transduction histidine kinase